MSVPHVVGITQEGWQFTARHARVPTLSEWDQIMDAAGLNVYSWCCLDQPDPDPITKHIGLHPDVLSRAWTYAEKQAPLVQQLYQQHQ